MPGFVFGVAELLEVADIAFGIAGDAHLAAMMDDLVGEVDPFFAGQDFH